MSWVRSPLAAPVIRLRMAMVGPKLWPPTGAEDLESRTNSSVSEIATRDDLNRICAASDRYRVSGEDALDFIDLSIHTGLRCPRLPLRWSSNNRSGRTHAT